MQLGTSGWYTRVSARSIPPWSTHQQADPWHWIFSNSPSSVHLGWYTPNSPCLLLSNCKTQAFRPVPLSKRKVDFIRYHSNNHFFMVFFFFFTTLWNISIDLIKVQHWHCHFWHLYYVSSHFLIYLYVWVGYMPNTRLVLGWLKQTIMWYTSSITTGMSFLFFSCRLKIFPGGSLTLVSQSSVRYYT